MTDHEARVYLELVRTKVRKFLGPGRRPHDVAVDREDLVQEAFARVLARLPNFDPARASLATFIARIVESALLDFARRMAAAKRNPDRCGLAPVKNFDIGDVADPRADSLERARDLAIDLAEAIARLPPVLQDTADQLKHGSAALSAEREGVHPGTIYRRMEALRRRWEGGTLRDYVDF